MLGDQRSGISASWKASLSTRRGIALRSEERDHAKRSSQRGGEVAIAVIRVCGEEEEAEWDAEALEHELKLERIARQWEPYAARLGLLEEEEGVGW